MQINRQSDIEDRQSPLPFTFRPPGRVDGRYVGRHRSVKRGRSQTFEDHRPYVAGDDVRDVDWKLYARSDKLYVKRYEMHAQLAVHMVLDASASMTYAGRPRNKGGWAGKAAGLPLSKWAAAKVAAAGLSRIVLAQQDRVGLAFRDVDGLQRVDTRAGVDHLTRMQSVLSRAVPSGKVATEQVVAELAAQHRRAVAVVFSDLMHPRKQLLDALSAWRARGGEAVVMQVLHPDEISLPADWNPAEAIDPESEQKVSFDPLKVGDAYQARSAEWVQGWRHALASKGVDHQVLVCGRPWVDAMRQWLSPL